MQVKVTFARAPKTGREGGHTTYKDVRYAQFVDGVLVIESGELNSPNETITSIPAHNVLLVEATQ